jgi:hypothetical protein
MRLERILRQSVVMVLGLAGAAWLIQARAASPDQTMVSSCPGVGPLPVRFQVDCSHLTDSASKQLCRQFIENQACKVFPAYRKITGIKLEDKCKVILFTIYEDSNWPHPKGEGGLALNCAVDYLEQYSVKSHKDSKMGPYDVHELLHEYQFTLGPLPSMHPLFASSMAEAARAVGDEEQYQLDIKRMRTEAKRLHDELQSGKYKGDPKECSIAQAQVEESLYLDNPKLVSMFYLKLPPAQGNSQAERDARFDRMFLVVSSAKPEIKRFLTDHRCGPF